MNTSTESPESRDSLRQQAAELIKKMHGIEFDIQVESNAPLIVSRLRHAVDALQAVIFQALGDPIPQSGGKIPAGWMQLTNRSGEAVFTRQASVTLIKSVSDAAGMTAIHCVDVGALQVREPIAEVLRLVGEAQA